MSWQTGLGITPILTSYPGDMNLDGAISWMDVSHARRCIGLLAEGTCTQADFDVNGFVSLSDVIHTAQAIGTSCTP